MTRKTRTRLGLALGAAVAAAGLAAPHFNADRLGDRARNALEQAMGRRIEIGEVRVHLFPAPGITVANVVIHEQPAYGSEPAAYVTSLDARVRLGSLWKRRLEFTSLRLDEPSINLVRISEPDGTTRWNFEPVIARAGRDIPEVLLSDGRINIKFGRAKSVFYLSNADARLNPPRDGNGEWRLEITGEPSRSDRPAHGFGTLVCAGKWHPGGSVEAQLRLDRSALADLSALMHGEDLGIHGLVWARIRLAGQMSALTLSGSAQVDDLHRWDMIPPHAASQQFVLEGELDPVRQLLTLEAKLSGEKPSPVRIRLRAADYISRPRWGMVAEFNAMAAAPLLDTARHLGAPVPAEMSAEGAITGAVGYSLDSGFQGKVVVSGAALRFPPASGISLEDPVVVAGGGKVQLLPVPARWGDSRLKLEAEYSPGAGLFRAAMDSDVLRLDAVAGYGALAGVPLVSNLRDGTCRGRLRYETSPAGNLWNARLELAGTSFAVPGISEPVRLDSGSLEIQGARVALSRMQAHAGPVAWSGDYSYEPDAVRPHRFHLSIPELDAAAAENLLRPTLNGGRGFLARTLGFGGGRPDWLEQRRAEGSIEIGRLELPGYAAGLVRAKVFWDADTVEFTNLSGGLLEGSMTGSLSLRLRAAGPEYRIAYRLEGARWNNGRLRSAGVLRTSGFGRELWSHLAGEGRFEGRTLVLDTATELDSLAGGFEIGGRSPRLRFSDLELAMGDVRLQGKGASGEDGRLLLEFDEGNRRLRISVAPEGLKLDREPAEAPGEKSATGPPGV
jgi:hypothetical protein